MMERTDIDGRWESMDGVAWTLVDPSSDYLARADEHDARAQALIDAEDASADRAAAKAEAADAVSRLTVLDKLDTLDDATIAAVAAVFSDWEPGIAVAVGEVYRWDGTLVEVIQAHTTQADWTPDKVPALFKIHRTAAVAPWVQPTGAQDAYKLGEQVTHNGQTWTNTGSDANVWEPGVFGWTVA